MKQEFAAMRQNYKSNGLNEADLCSDPIEQFRTWFEEARQAGIHEPNAMALATADTGGQPSIRIVLLKDIDQRGLAFFTNLESRKGRELKENPRAALNFWWGALMRQVSFEGTVKTVEDIEADKYFASRPIGSRLGAWASEQSSVIESRASLEAAERKYRTQFSGDDVPRPEFWGGFPLVPYRVEFWQGRQNRLHDRLVFSRNDSDRSEWRTERLAP